MPRSLDVHEVRLGDALDRVLAGDVAAGGDVPPFETTAMDGFAVHAGPAGRRLAVVGESRAGAPAGLSVGVDEAVRISTGAVVPAGAEAVIELERASEEDDSVVPQVDIAPGRNLRHAGDDLRAGHTVLSAGTRLGPAELGVASAAGVPAVSCFRPATVGLVVTGDELRPAGTPLGPGQIHDANGIALWALARREGALAQPAAHVGDSAGDTEAALREALGADVVIVSGGVSVGEHDHVRPALARLGVTEVFWGVALKPGRPTWFGVRDATLVFALPGNPVSAVVTFLLFVRPALAALQGSDPSVRRREAMLDHALPRRPERAEAVRVALRDDDGALRATPTGPQDSHILSSMLGADGLAIVDAGDGEVPAGERVTVELI